MRVSWRFLLVVRVSDDKRKFSFRYIEVFAYYVYNLVYSMSLITRTTNKTRGVVSPPVIPGQRTGSGPGSS